jgi:hypothetical protein
MHQHCHVSMHSIYCLRFSCALARDPKPCRGNKAFAQRLSVHCGCLAALMLQSSQWLEGSRLTPSTMQSLASLQAVHNCAIDVTANRFELGRIGNMLFLAAAVDLPGFDTRGWINIWQGTSEDHPGTLYCALRYRAEYRQRCLCGSCHPSWITQGWVCELLQW